ncbi:MAG: response regulator, partial [Planctomycetes bacterium]|nr:response regulator [Planctomycetota bacterium]
GGIAHDFNNLLLAILANAELARQTLPSNMSAAQNLTRIEAASRRAADLCQQLLAYSGKAQSTLAPVSVSALVREVFSILEVSVSKRTKLELDLARDLPAVKADRAQLTQVIMNLITNASEAIEHDQGQVRITTKYLQANPNEIQNVIGENLMEGQDFVLLEVEDNGVGMSEATRQRIFEPFFTTKFQGRGLGMAAVLGIVRSHGGAIALDTEVGRGTKFSVYLPATEEAASAEVGFDRILASDEFANFRVMVVDDEAMFLDIAHDILKRLSLEVLVAQSGAIAIETLRTKAPIDLVLLDMTMPEMDGAETARRLREIDPEIKIVISSGYSELTLKEALKDIKVNGILAKPYLMEELTASVKKLLSIDS